MRVTTICAFTLVTVLAVVLLASEARAQSSGHGTCSVTMDNTGADGNLRAWMIVPTDTATFNAATGCTSSPSPAITLREVVASGSITLKCIEGTAGAASPPDSTSVTIKGFPDNDNFGSTSATPIWTWNPGATCNSNPTFTAFCTSDGTNTGTPQYGLVRIQVHALDNPGVSVYDVNSETPNPTPTGENDVGIYRCDPKPTLMQPANQPSASTPWKGGQTYDARIALDSNAYGASPGNTGSVLESCASVESTPTSAQLGTTPTSQNDLIEGTPQQYQSGCTMKTNASLTKTSSISLYASTSFAVWNQAAPISGVTFPSASTATFTSHALSRILNVGGTCASSFGGTPTTLFNRGETAHVAGCGPWTTHADGANVPNAQRAQAWIVQAGAWETYTDFQGSNSTFGATGALMTDNFAQDAGSGCTSTNPGSNSCATTSTGLAYHETVDECDGACTSTDSTLMNWGNTSGILDVTSAYQFASINNAKTAGGTNVTTFTISVDTEFAQPKGLHDAAGVFVQQANVTCDQIRPAGTTFQSILMGATDANGNAPEQSFTVQAPKGTWALDCHASMNGNAADYRITFFFASAYTADTALGVKWNVSYVPANGTFLVNVTGVLRSYDPSVDDVSSTFPDTQPKCTVQAFDANTGRYSRVVIDRAVMTQTAPTSANFWCLFWTSRANLVDDYAFVYANVTGSPFVGSQGYALPGASGMLAVVGDLSVYGNATITGNTQAARFVGKYDISQADGMISTSSDSYIQFFVFAGIAACATILGVWGIKQSALAAKVTLVAVLVLAAIWAGTASVDAGQSNVRWISVIITAGWALLLAATAKPTRG